MKPRKTDLEKLLARIYRYYQKLDDPRLNAIARQDFVFHMTDWLDNFKDLVALYENPVGQDTQTAAEQIYRFLIHAPAHLNAAAFILSGFRPHCFEDTETEVFEALVKALKA